MSSELNGPQTVSLHRELFLKSKRYRKKIRTNQEREDSLNLVCFTLQDETYGIELDALKEVLKALDIVRIPKSPDYLRGIINLRGAILTVIDLKGLIGLSPSEIMQSSRILILQQKERQIGILVDSVTEIIRLEKNRIVSPPEGMEEQRRKFVRALGETEKETIILPDLQHFFIL